jgi:hypothetical protein
LKKSNGKTFQIILYELLSCFEYAQRWLNI